MVRGQKGKKDESSEADPPMRNIHYKGALKSIAFAKLANGTEPAREFYDDLDEDDKDRFDRLFVYLGDTGEIRNTEKYRQKVGEITCNRGSKAAKYPVAEFKIHTGAGKRILAVAVKDQIVLTHGFTKGKNLLAEVKRTEHIFRIDISRTD